MIKAKIMDKIQLIREDCSDIPCRFKYNYEFDTSGYKIEELKNNIYAVPTLRTFNQEDFNEINLVIIDNIVNDFRFRLNEMVFGRKLAELM